jgi:transcriptional regulator with XRE-family HTH domain
MAVGERIKRARNFRGFTQKAFGMALGFDEKSADVRVAQYESNKRTPKEDMLRKMSGVLDVNYRSLYEPTLYAAEDIMYSLFELDEHYPISLHEIIDDSDPVFPTKRMAVNFNSKLLDDFMGEWMKKKQEFKDGIITKEEYFEWKVNWPDTSDA